ncbi:hypothetical protein [Neorhizobium lilium]|uniref:hypothetical protein n=1 Tax=Neorhizobium lilium TaxID=2503024 RepID=UPI0013E331AC|nr:hypothetical protein [Neorhizobium lilium]
MPRHRLHGFKSMINGRHGLFASHALDAPAVARDRRHKRFGIPNLKLVLTIAAKFSAGILATALRPRLQSKSLIMNACVDHKPVLMLPCQMGRRGALLLTLQCSVINLNLLRAVAMPVHGDIGKMLIHGGGG